MHSPVALLPVVDDWTRGRPSSACDEFELEIGELAVGTGHHLVEFLPDVVVGEEESVRFPQLDHEVPVQQRGHVRHGDPLNFRVLVDEGAKVKDCLSGH